MQTSPKIPSRVEHRVVEFERKYGGDSKWLEKIVESLVSKTLHWIV